MTDGSDDPRPCEVSLTRPLAGTSRCRRRDSNPRHADYDSAPEDHEKRKDLQIAAFISRENTSEYVTSGSFRAYSWSIRGRFHRVVRGR
jgi:hypothetical protein